MNPGPSSQSEHCCFPTSAGAPVGVGGAGGRQISPNAGSLPGRRGGMCFSCLHVTPSMQLNVFQRHRARSVPLPLGLRQTPAWLGSAAPSCSSAASGTSLPGWPRAALEFRHEGFASSLPPAPSSFPCWRGMGRGGCRGPALSCKEASTRGVSWEWLSDCPACKCSAEILALERALPRVRAAVPLPGRAGASPAPGPTNASFRHPGGLPDLQSPSCDGGGVGQVKRTSHSLHPPQQVSKGGDVRGV